MSTGEVFVLFGGLHLLTVVACALLIALFAIAGRALRKRSAEARLRKPFAVFALIYWFVYIIWWNWNGLDIDGGLPLHLCDFNGLVAPLALDDGAYIAAGSVITENVPGNALALGRARQVVKEGWKRKGD